MEKEVDEISLELTMSEGKAWLSSPNVDFKIEVSLKAGDMAFAEFEGGSKQLIQYASHNYSGYVYAMNADSLFELKGVKKLYRADPREIVKQRNLTEKPG